MMLDVEFAREREVASLSSKLGNGKVKIVAGLRRAGKSYLLDPLFKRHLMREKGFQEENFACMDFSKQNRISDAAGLKRYLSEVSKRKEVRCLFLDEAQECGEGFAEAILKFHHMHESIDIYLTGSNSKTLSEDIVKLFGDDGDPLFIESLSYREIVDVLPGFSLRDYFTVGGLPLILRQESESLRLRALEGLLRNLYLTDIRSRLEASSSLRRLSPSEAGDVIQDACANLTSPISITGLARRYFGKGRGGDASDKNAFSLDCLAIMNEAENAYLLYRYAYPYPKAEERNPHAWVSHQFKYYCYDLGLLEAIAFSDDPRGICLENAVYLELRRRGIESRPLILLDEKGNEKANIDFSFSYQGRDVLLQVTHEINAYDEEREVKKLASIDGDYRKCIVYVNNVLGSKEGGIEYLKAESFFRDFL